MITIKCHNCGKILNIDDSYAGKSGHCARCGVTISVPIVVMNDVQAEIQDKLERAEVEFNPFETVAYEPRPERVAPLTVAAGAKPFNNSLIASIGRITAGVFSVIFFTIFITVCGVYTTKPESTYHNSVPPQPQYASYQYENVDIINASDWKAAEDIRRLALCSDFLMKTSWKNYNLSTQQDIDRLLEKASMLYTAITITIGKLERKYADTEINIKLVAATLISQSDMFNP